ncbi:hypothetical protein JOQ06_024417 [Pogonophryne albipinna]|uniref:Uncharacterized protein n=1 Tax=Pogonophryne albipinna TaxID=1090488 RepID=A0AAD6F413_9TELE|nr:hypothetical protein JOQ06_024417 [Pogonophryne albipinna]
MNEHILFCKKLTGRTTGQDVFNVIDYFFSQHKLDWKSCSHVCTDGAAAMTGRVNGLMAHIKKLKNEFNSYFPDIDNKSSTLDWVRNPFVTCINSSIPARLQEDLIDVSSDRSLKMRYSSTPLTQFWCGVEKEYPELGKHALNELLPFGSTYLCEVTLSAMTHIKTKHRNRLILENNLVTAVATISPRLTKLMREKQAQVSH